MIAFLLGLLLYCAIFKQVNYLKVLGIEEQKCIFANVTHFFVLNGRKWTTSIEATLIMFISDFLYGIDADIWFAYYHGFYDDF